MAAENFPISAVESGTLGGADEPQGVGASMDSASRRAERQERALWQPPAVRPHSPALPLDIIEMRGHGPVQ